MDEKAMQELTKHLREHVKYPATKQVIIDQCNQMEHVPVEAQRLVKDGLPNRSYKSADEVMAALPI